MTSRKFKQIDTAKALLNQQHTAHLNVIMGFSKQGLVAKRLWGFEIAKFYQAHPELLHELKKSAFGYEYSVLFEEVMNSPILEYSKTANAHRTQLTMSFERIKNTLNTLAQYEQFTSCMHLRDELFHGVDAMQKSDDITIITKAMIEILSSILTKLYEVKK